MFLKNRQKAFYVAFKGIRYFITEGIHAKVMMFALLVAIGMGVFFKVNTFEWITIVICAGLVLSLEAINSALEYLVDLVSPQKHILAKKCKDTAAGSVLIASICAFAVGLIIFLPKIYQIFA